MFRYKPRWSKSRYDLREINSYFDRRRKNLTHKHKNKYKRWGHNCVVYQLQPELRSVKIFKREFPYKHG